MQQRQNYNFFIKDPKKAMISLVLTLVFVVTLLIMAPPLEEENGPGEPPQTENVGQGTIDTGIVAPVITASEAREMMESGQPYILLDVRTLEEFERQHIPGAISMPHTELADRVTAVFFDLDARILLYCQTGRRSAEAGRILVGLGYTNVYDFGGIADWPY